MSFANNVSLALRRGAELFLKWWIGQPFPEDVRTPRGLLKFLHAIGPELLEAAVFGYAAWRVVAQHVCPDGTSWTQWLSCKAPALPAVVLVVIVAVVFHFSRTSVEAELSFTELIFTGARVPKQWTGRNDPVWITAQVLLWFLSYIAIASFAASITIVSGLLLLIACLDWNTRRAIHHRIRLYFADRRYALAPTDSNYKSVVESRNVISWYLYEKPHLWKEAAKAAGCAVSFSLAIAWQMNDSAPMRAVSYVMLISTLIVNEIITLRWRRERNRRLGDIASEAV